MIYNEKVERKFAELNKENRDLRDKCGRAMHKIDTQKKEIAKLREELEGYKELLTANDAIVAAVLHAVGADKDKPIKVDRAVIGAAVKGQYLGISEVKEEDPSVFWLHYEEFALEDEECEGGESGD